MVVFCRRYIPGIALEGNTEHDNLQPPSTSPPTWSFALAQGLPRSQFPGASPGLGPTCRATIGLRSWGPGRARCGAFFGVQVFPKQHPNPDDHQRNEASSRCPVHVQPCARTHPGKKKKKKENTRAGVLALLGWWDGMKIPHGRKPSASAEGPCCVRSRVYCMQGLSREKGTAIALGLKGSAIRLALLCKGHARASHHYERKTLTYCVDGLVLASILSL